MGLRESQTGTLTSRPNHWISRSLLEVEALDNGNKVVKNLTNRNERTFNAIRADRNGRQTSNFHSLAHWEPTDEAKSVLFLGDGRFLRCFL